MWSKYPKLAEDTVGHLGRPDTLNTRELQLPAVPDKIEVPMKKVVTRDRPEIEFEETTGIHLRFRHCKEPNRRWKRFLGL